VDADSGFCPKIYYIYYKCKINYILIKNVSLHLVSVGEEARASVFDVTRKG